ncbi:MAG: sulfate ABC transporter substrate-binding protein [Betaproteobacteria bacterium]|jgi:sulfate transport system substrate-binding protein
MKPLKTLLLALLLLAGGASAQTTLLNVSYDVMRDFYKDLNPAFQKHWKARSGQEVTVQMSHGGSSRQARAVADGLEADVITMNQHNDIDLLAQRGGLVPADWAKRLPNNSAPFTSATVFIVRKGNPKGIKDWPDLVKEGVQAIIPNPKTSGNGRYTYLNGWAFAQKQPGGNAQKAEEFVTRLFRNVPVLDTGGRGATSTFIQRNIGDVLVTFENEAELIAREFGRGGFEVVYPSLTFLVEPPVSVVDKVVDKKGTRAAAQAYLEFLYSAEGQEIAAQNYLRPRNAEVAKRHADKFPALRTVSIDEFGGWQQAQKTHFDDGGIFDRVIAAAGKK